MTEMKWAFIIAGGLILLFLIDFFNNWQRDTSQVKAMCYDLAKAGEMAAHDLVCKERKNDKPDAAAEAD